MKLTESERGAAFEAMRRRQVGDVPEPPAWVVSDPFDRGDSFIIGGVVACMVAVIVAVACGIVLYGARVVVGGG